MSDRRSPIGVFDSGIGGLTVARELMRQLPGERLVYLGDTARTPYGNKSPENLVRFALETGGFLSRQGIKLLVVACNTSSAYSLPALRKKLKIPVVGVILAGARAAVGRRHGPAHRCHRHPRHGPLGRLSTGHPRPGTQRQSPGSGLPALCALGGRRLVDG